MWRSSPESSECFMKRSELLQRNATWRDEHQQLDKLTHHEEKEDRLQKGWKPFRYQHFLQAWARIQIRYVQSTAPE